MLSSNEILYDHGYLGPADKDQASLTDGIDQYLNVAGSYGRLSAFPETNQRKEVVHQLACRRGQNVERNSIGEGSERKLTVAVAPSLSFHNLTPLSS